MAQAKTASKNDPSTRGEKVKKRKYQNKDVNPVLYIGESRRYMAAGLATIDRDTRMRALTFSTAVNYVSFLWGSPDTYNLLTVNSAGASQTFDVAGTHAGGFNGDGIAAKRIAPTATACVLMRDDVSRTHWEGRDDRKRLGFPVADQRVGGRRALLPAGEAIR